MAKKTSQYKKRKGSSSPAPEQAFVEGVVQGVWHVLSWLFSQATPKKKKHSNKAELKALKEHWELVELHVLQETTRANAISEADKILDTAFKLIGLPGETMGDRLRAAEDQFDGSLYNEIWQAHKLRNTLAHEVGAKVSVASAQKAVSAFRQALYSLGVLV